MSSHLEKVQWPKFENLGQFDGSNWRYYYTPKTTMILTGSGQDLVEDTGLQFFKMISSYRRALEVGLEDSDERSYIAEGRHAKVYGTILPKVVVKESVLKTQKGIDNAYQGEVLYTLERMDFLAHVAEEGRVPRWIQVPHNYAAIFIPHDNSAYFFMERIDDGVSVGDILSYDSISESRRAAVDRNFGPEIESNGRQALENEVIERFLTAEELFRKALTEIKVRPEQYLTDLNESNVLIERLRTPIGGSSLKLSIIDQ